MKKTVYCVAAVMALMSVFASDGFCKDSNLEEQAAAAGSQFGEAPITAASPKAIMKSASAAAGIKENTASRLGTTAAPEAPNLKSSAEEMNLALANKIQIEDDNGNVIFKGTVQGLLAKAQVKAADVAPAKGVDFKKLMATAFICSLAGVGFYYSFTILVGVPFGAGILGIMAGLMITAITKLYTSL